MASIPLMSGGKQKPGTRIDERSLRSSSPVSSIHDTVDHGPSSINEPAEEKEGHVERLTRSSWAVFIVVPYAAVAALAWSVICIQTVRPITTASYSYYDDSGQPGSRYDNMRSAYDRNEAWYKAATVLQSIIGVLTIPITSAVCSKAAVVFAQAPRRRNLTLRQTMTLADHGWTDPIVYLRLMTSGFKRHSSTLLILAALLNILGALLAPLQTVLVTASHTKTPGQPLARALVPDVMTLFVQPQDHDNLVSVLTRSALTSTIATDPQSRLWGGQRTCSTNSSERLSCLDGPSSLTNISTLNDPFFAQVPNGTSTGLITQYLPRMNSSVTRENVSVEEFPKDCAALDGAFFAHYYHDGQLNSTNFAGNWSMTACMPANQTLSPWNATRNRQDISEQLYLNITSNSVEAKGYAYAGLFKITLNTTLGCFELPNYANGQTPGPILDVCPITGTLVGSQEPPAAGVYRRDDTTLSGLSNSTLAIATTSNKGPLLAISMALFGEGSFIANRFYHPEIYLENTTNTQMWNDINRGANENMFARSCLEQEPMMGLFADIEPEVLIPNYPGCVLGRENSPNNVQQQVDQWLLALGNTFTEDRVEAAFKAAAFLANEAWMSGPQANPDLYVSYDMGFDSQLPVVSFAGKLVISILLGIYLTGLLLMALYASRRPTWTSTLNAFAMLRIGAAIGPELPLKYARSADAVDILDATPGYVGARDGCNADATGLQLGSTKAFTSKKVEAYDETRTSRSRWVRRR